MTASSYDGYPFRPLGEWQQRLIKDGASPAQALSRLNTDLTTGRLQLKEPLPFRRLRSLSRGRLEIETTDGRLIEVTDLEARYRPPPAEPDLLGPTTPVDDALKERIMARINQLGGAYVVSSSGVGFVPPTASEPPAAPTPTAEVTPKPPKPERLPGWLKAVDAEVTDLVRDGKKYPSLDSLVTVIEGLLKAKDLAVPNSRNIERGLNKHRSDWFINQGRKGGV